MRNKSPKAQDIPHPRAVADARNSAPLAHLFANLEASILLAESNPLQTPANGNPRGMNSTSVTKRLSFVGPTLPRSPTLRRSSFTRKLRAPTFGAVVQSLTRLLGANPACSATCPPAQHHLFSLPSGIIAVDRRHRQVWSRRDNHTFEGEPPANRLY
jgi:hypothetical protein